MSPSAPFLEAIKNRRTIYALKKESTISDAKVQEIINHVILHTPSSFNSQTTRVVLLVKEEHNKLWDITKEVLKSIVPAENYPATEQRLNGFQAGYGTVSLHSSLPFLIPTNKPHRSSSSNPPPQSKS
jgi:predicted oxidoreductase (fatty acid repression mutant protein)